MTQDPKKSLGQHWLIDEESLERISRYAEISKDDLVVEVGPGTGNLTKYINRYTNNLIAIEKDDNLSEELKHKFPNLKIIAADILKFNLDTIPSDYLLIGNLPYYLTSNFIRKISELKNKPKRAVLLIQKEVADRIADNINTSIISITTQLYWNVELKEIVSSDKFYPPPKVDSRIIVLRRKDELALPDQDRQDFIDLVKLGFSQKRKKLINNLSRKYTKAKLDKAIEVKNIRSQQLTLDHWINLYLNLK